MSKIAHAGCALFLGFALSYGAKLMLQAPLRHPSSTTLTPPSTGDLSSAPPSAILLHGAARKEQLRQLIVEGSGRNSFDIHTLYSIEADDSHAAAAGKAARLMLGPDSSATYLTRFRLEGRLSEAIAQFIRDEESAYGVRMRLLSVHEGHDGFHYSKPSGCGNDMVRYHPQLGSLVLFFGEAEYILSGTYRSFQIELPLREGEYIGSRQFAWSVDKSEAEAIGSLRWQRLKPEEARIVEARWNQEWKQADRYHRTLRLCAGPPPADQDAPAPSWAGN